MSLIRLSKEDAKREAGITYADVKMTLLVLVTVFGAYSFLQSDIKAAEQRAINAIERNADNTEATLIEFQLDVLEDRHARVKENYGVPESKLADVISPSDSAKLAGIESRIRRLEAKQKVLDAKNSVP